MTGKFILPYTQTDPVRPARSPRLPLPRRRLSAPRRTDWGTIRYRKLVRLAFIKTDIWRGKMVCCHKLLLKLTKNLNSVAEGWARFDTPLVWIYAPVLPSDQWPRSGGAARQHQTKTQLWLRVSAAYKHRDGAAVRRLGSPHSRDNINWIYSTYGRVFICPIQVSDDDVWPHSGSIRLSINRPRIADCTYVAADYSFQCNSLRHCKDGSILLWAHSDHQTIFLSVLVLLPGAD